MLTPSFGRPTPLLTASLACGSLILSSAAMAARGPAIFSPLPGAWIAGDRVVIETSDGCPRITLDGVEVASELQYAPYAHSEWRSIDLSQSGQHHLSVKWECRKDSPISREISFYSGPASQTALNIGEALAWNFMDHHPADKLEWNWTDAIFLHGLERLRKVSPRLGSSFTQYLKDYHSSWSARGIPTVDRSDRCASALSAAALLREGFEPALPAVNAVANYLRTAKRYEPGVLNHLGTCFMNLIYPASAWADSLMMYAVFATEAGQQLGDDALRDFGAAQPLRFAQLLRDRNTGLFHHSYIFSQHTAVPHNADWLRGNGWVLASTAEILETLSANHPDRSKLLALLEEMSAAALKLQMNNGEWDTLMDRAGGAYPETSGSALIAYAWLKGVRRGWLPSSYREPALKVLTGVSARTTALGSGSLSLTGISGPTNALPAFTYRLVGQKSDLGYGLGAFMLLASEAALLEP